MGKIEENFQIMSRVGTPLMKYRNGTISNHNTAIFDMSSAVAPTPGTKLTKVNSSRGRLKSKRQRAASPPNIFEPLVELRSTAATKAGKSAYDETYKHLQAQLAKSHKKSQKLNLLRQQDSNLNPFFSTVQDPTPSETLEAESRKNQALLEIYTDSGTFSKVVAMTVAASVLDTKMPCDVTQSPLDPKKKEELYKFCHDVSAILGIQDMKSLEANDYRRLWHLFSIFTNAVEQQRHRPDENAITANSTQNIYSGRNGKSVPLEATVSDADLVENIKNTNPTLYAALSDPLKRFLIVYGRYIEAGHAVKSKTLRNNALNEYIKRYRERMSIKLRGANMPARPESARSKAEAPQQTAQDLKILQSLRKPSDGTAKFTITESSTPSMGSIDSADDNAKYAEDPEFGSNHLLDKIKKSNGLAEAKKKEEISWVQAYHRTSPQLRGQAISSPISQDTAVSSSESIDQVNPASITTRSQPRRKKKKAVASTASLKTVVKRFPKRKLIAHSSSNSNSPGERKMSKSILHKISVSGTVMKVSSKNGLRKDAGKTTRKPKKATGNKSRSGTQQQPLNPIPIKINSSVVQSQTVYSRVTQLSKNNKGREGPSNNSRDEPAAAKSAPSTPRSVSYTSKSRILYCEAIYRGIIPKPKGDVPGLCPARCKTICLEGCRYDVVRRIALEAGFKEVGEHDVWNVIWTDIPISMEKALEMRRFQNAHTIFWGTNPPVQKANHFPGMNEICRKDRLARNLNRMKKSFPDDYNFFPRTWSLPADVADLLLYSRVKKNATYICKPDSGCQGKGIFLARNLKKLNPFAKLICQVYIPRPLLIDGYKFDLRIYILVTCCDPLRVFIYNEGIARFATIKYNPPSDSNIDTIYMHLTNYSLNKFSQSYDTHGDGSKRKMSSVLKTLEAGGCDVAKLRDAIDSVIVKTMIAAQPTLRHYYRASFPKHEYGSACFEILGFDILIDQNLKPFLLEVNHSPSFNLDLPVDAEIKEVLLKDTFNIIYLGAGKNDLKGRKAKTKQSAPSIGSSESIARLTKALQLQFAHENNHRGNYRLIYPVENGVDYEEFLDQLSNPSMLTDPSQMTRKRSEKVAKTKSVVY